MNVLLLTQFYSSGSTGGGDYVFYLIADMLAKKGLPLPRIICTHN